MARLPPSARLDGELRAGVGNGAAVPDKYSQQQGFAFSHQAGTAGAYGEARGVRAARERTVRCGFTRDREMRGQAEIQVERRPAGPSRTGRASHGRLERVAALTFFSSAFQATRSDVAFFKRCAPLSRIARTILPHLTVRNDAPRPTTLLENAGGQP